MEEFKIEVDGELKVFRGTGTTKKVERVIDEQLSSGKRLKVAKVPHKYLCLPVSQRRVTESRIKSMRNDLVEAVACSCVLYEEKIRGKYYYWLVDGQHRATASYEDFSVAIILNKDDLPENYQSVEGCFIILNKNARQISKVDHFHALKIRGEDERANLLIEYFNENLPGVVTERDEDNSKIGLVEKLHDLMMWQERWLHSRGHDYGFVFDKNVEDEDYKAEVADLATMQVLNMLDILTDPDVFGERIITHDPARDVYEDDELKSKGKTKPTGNFAIFKAFLHVMNSPPKGFTNLYGEHPHDCPTDMKDLLVNMKDQLITTGVKRKGSRFIFDNVSFNMSQYRGILGLRREIKQNLSVGLHVEAVRQMFNCVIKQSLK